MTWQRILLSLALTGSTLGAMVPFPVEAMSPSEQAAQADPMIIKIVTLKAAGPSIGYVLGQHFGVGPEHLVVKIDDIVVRCHFVNDSCIVIWFPERVTEHSLVAVFAQGRESVWYRLGKPQNYNEAADVLMPPSDDPYTSAFNQMVRSAFRGFPTLSQDASAASRQADQTPSSQATLGGVDMEDAPPGLPAAGRPEPQMAHTVPASAAATGSAPPSPAAPMPQRAPTGPASAAATGSAPPSPAAPLPQRAPIGPASAATGLAAPSPAAPMPQRAPTEPASAAHLLTFGETVVNLESGVFSKRGQPPRNLPPQEVRILKALARRQGQIVSTSDLAKEVWGGSETEHQSTLRSYILRLRKHLEPDPYNPIYLVMVGHRGYSLTPDD